MSLKISHQSHLQILFFSDGRAAVLKWLCVRYLVFEAASPLKCTVYYHNAVCQNFLYNRLTYLSFPLRATWSHRNSRGKGRPWWTRLDWKWGPSRAEGWKGGQGGRVQWCALCRWEAALGPSPRGNRPETCLDCNARAALGLLSSPTLWGHLFYGFEKEKTVHATSLLARPNLGSKQK